MARRARFSDFDGVITEEMLSDRQRAILDFIREHVYAKGYPPAVREIGKAVGLSSRGCCRYLRAYGSRFHSSA